MAPGASTGPQGPGCEGGTFYPPFYQEAIIDLSEAAPLAAYYRDLRRWASAKRLKAAASGPAERDQCVELLAWHVRQGVLQVTGWLARSCWALAMQG